MHRLVAAALAFNEDHPTLLGVVPVKTAHIFDLVSDVSSIAVWAIELGAINEVLGVEKGVVWHSPNLGEAEGAAYLVINWSH